MLFARVWSSERGFSMFNRIDLVTGAAQRAVFVFSDIREGSSAAGHFWEFSVADGGSTLAEKCAEVWPHLPGPIRAQLEAEGHSASTFGENLAGQWRFFKAWHPPTRPQLRVCLTVTGDLPALMPLECLQGSIGPAGLDIGRAQPAREGGAAPAAEYAFRLAAGVVYRVTYESARPGMHAFRAVRPDGSGLLWTEWSSKNEPLAPGEILPRAWEAAWRAEYNGSPSTMAETAIRCGA